MSNLKKYSYDWLAWLFFLFIAILVLWQSATSLKDQAAASGGPLQNAAAFPQSIAWLMLVLSLFNFMRIFRGRIANPSAVVSTKTTSLALMITLLFFIYLLTLQSLGYYIATPLLLSLFLKGLGLKWVKSFIVAISMTLLVASIFEGLLNVVLPLGFTKFTIFG